MCITEIVPPNLTCGFDAKYLFFLQLLPCLDLQTYTFHHNKVQSDLPPIFLRDSVIYVIESLWEENGSPLS